MQWGTIADGRLPGDHGAVEFVFDARVYRRWRRLLAALAPVVAIFWIWDAVAIAAATGATALGTRSAPCCRERCRWRSWSSSW